MSYQITLDDYLGGYRASHGGELTDAILADAEQLVSRANLILFAAAKDGVILVNRPGSRSLVVSGWVPPSINRTQAGDSAACRHIIGQAVDISDPRGDLDRYLMSRQHLLAEAQLWLAHPDTTHGHCHLQSCPPASRLRVFYP